MEEKNKDIELNLLKKDHKGLLINAETENIVSLSDNLKNDNLDSNPGNNFTNTNVGKFTLEKSQDLLLENKDLDNCKINLKDFVGYIKPYFSRSVPQAFNGIVPYTISLFSQQFLGWYNNAIYSGGFGLAQTMFLCQFGMIIIIHSECFGIFLTERFGKNDWKGLREVFLRGLFVKIILVFINIFWLSFTRPVLVYINIEPEIAAVVSDLTFYLIPSMIHIALNYALQTCQVSMKITQPLTYLNVVMVIQQIPVCYVFIWKTGMGLLGYAIARFVLEVIYLILLMIVCKYYMDKRAFEFQERFSEVFAWEPLKDYILVFWPILYGWYSSFLGFELLVLMIGNTHDTEFLAAWVIAFQVIIVTFCLNAGVANITRTDIIIPIQQDCPIKAQKYAYLGIIMNGLLSIILGLLIIIFSKQISELFTSLPGILNYLYYIVPIGGLVVMPNNLFATQSTILRVLNKSRILAWLYVVPMFTFMVGGGYILMFCTDWFKGYLVWTFFMYRIVASTIAFLIIYYYNWQDIKSK